jgi:hypothetical protein
MRHGPCAVSTVAMAVAVMLLCGDSRASVPDFPYAPFGSDPAATPFALLDVTGPTERGPRITLLDAQNIHIAYAVVTVDWIAGAGRIIYPATMPGTIVASLLTYRLTLSGAESVVEYERRLRDVSFIAFRPVSASALANSVVLRLTMVSTEGIPVYRTESRVRLFTADALGMAPNLLPSDKVHLGFAGGAVGFGYVQSASFPPHLPLTIIGPTDYNVSFAATNYSNVMRDTYVVVVAPGRIWELPHGSVVGSPSLPSDARLMLSISRNHTAPAGVRYSVKATSSYSLGAPLCADDSTASRWCHPATPLTMIDFAALTAILADSPLTRCYLGGFGDTSATFRWIEGPAAGAPVLLTWPIGEPNDTPSYVTARKSDPDYIFDFKGVADGGVFTTDSVCCQCVDREFVFFTNTSDPVAAIGGRLFPSRRPMVTNTRTVHVSHSRTAVLTLTDSPASVSVTSSATGSAVSQSPTAAQTLTDSAASVSVTSSATGSAISMTLSASSNHSTSMAISATRSFGATRSMSDTVSFSDARTTSATMTLRLTPTLTQTRTVPRSYSASFSSSATRTASSSEQLSNSATGTLTHSQTASESEQLSDSATVTLTRSKTASRNTPTRSRSLAYSATWTVFPTASRATQSSTASVTLGATLSLELESPSVHVTGTITVQFAESQTASRPDSTTYDLRSWTLVTTTSLSGPRRRSSLFFTPALDPSPLADLPWPPEAPSRCRLQVVNADAADDSSFRAFIETNISIHALPRNKTTPDDDTAITAHLFVPPFSHDATVAAFGPTPADALAASRRPASVQVDVRLSPACFGATVLEATSSPLRITFLGPARSTSASEARAKEAETVATATVATIGVAVSGATAAGQVSRTGFALELLACVVNDGALGVTQSPMRQTVGGGLTQYHTGAALFNWIFIALIAAAQVSVAYMLSVLDDEPMQLTLAAVRSPSLLAFALLLFIDSTSSGAVISVVHGDGSQRALGILSLLVVFAVVIFVYWKFAYSFRAALLPDDDPDFINGSSARQRALVLALERRGESAHRESRSRKTSDGDADVAIANDRRRARKTPVRSFVFGSCHWHDAVTLTAGQIVRAKLYELRLLNNSVLLRNICKARVARLQMETSDSPEQSTSDDQLLVALLDHTGTAAASPSTPPPSGVAVAAASHSVGFCKRNKMFFNEYNSRVRWFFAVELALNTAVGILDGMKFGSGKCAAVGIAYLAVVFAYFVLLLTLQPFNSGAEFAFAVLVTAIQLASASCFVAGWFIGNAAIFETSTLLVEIGMYAVLSKVGLDALHFVAKTSLRIIDHRRSAKASKVPPAVFAISSPPPALLPLPIDVVDCAHPESTKATTADGQISSNDIRVDVLSETETLAKPVWDVEALQAILDSDGCSQSAHSTPPLPRDAPPAIPRWQRFESPALPAEVNPRGVDQGFRLMMDSAIRIVDASRQRRPAEAADGDDFLDRILAAATADDAARIARLSIL